MGGDTCWFIITVSIEASWCVASEVVFASETHLKLYNENMILMWQYLNDWIILLGLLERMCFYSEVSWVGGTALLLLNPVVFKSVLHGA